MKGQETGRQRKEGRGEMEEWTNVESFEHLAYKSKDGRGRVCEQKKEVRVGGLDASIARERREQQRSNEPRGFVRFIENMTAVK